MPFQDHALPEDYPIYPANHIDTQLSTQPWPSNGQSQASSSYQTLTTESSMVWYSAFPMPYDWTEANVLHGHLPAIHPHSVGTPNHVAGWGPIEDLEVSLYLPHDSADVAHECSTVRGTSRPSEHQFNMAGNHVHSHRPTTVDIIPDSNSSPGMEKNSRYDFSRFNAAESQKPCHPVSHQAIGYRRCERQS